MVMEAPTMQQFSAVAAAPLDLGDLLAGDDFLLLMAPPTSGPFDDLLFTAAGVDMESGSTSGSLTSVSDTELDFDLDADALSMMLEESPVAKRRRKRTYDTRKDEIDSLSQAAVRLGAKLDFLQHRAGVHDARSVAQKLRRNAELRAALRTQQLQLAGARSMMSVDPSPLALSPVSTRIHLERDLASRRRALRAVKFQKLHDARRFLEKRAQFASRTARLSESTRCETRAGETCAVKFDIVPLRRAASVREAFDAVMFYFAHLEICSTEALGDVTVRESELAETSSSSNNSSKAKGGSTHKDTSDITQHRFVRRHRQRDANEVEIETNSVIFAEYAPSHRCAQTGECRAEALVVTDFVDRDDLYPYRPRERLRKDITSILHLRAFPVADAAPGEHVVVLTMWYQATLRRGECAMPLDCERAIVEDTDRVYRATLSSIRSLMQRPMSSFL